MSFKRYCLNFKILLKVDFHWAALLDSWLGILVVRFSSLSNWRLDTTVCQTIVNWEEWLGNLAKLFVVYFCLLFWGLILLSAWRRVASWLVRLSPDRAVWVRALAGDVVLCCWSRHFTVTAPLSIQVHKWVPAICGGNLTNCGDVTCDGLAFRLGGVGILLAASCYRNQDKLRQLYMSQSWLQGFTSLCFLHKTWQKTKGGYVRSYKWSIVTLWLCNSRILDK